MYHESLLDWLKIANEYKIPTYVLGVGLGGSILLNLLEKNNCQSRDYVNFSYARTSKEWKKS